MLNISEENIANNAADVRQKLGLTAVYAPDMPSVLDQLSEKISMFKYRSALASQMGGDDAFMDESEHLLTVKEAVLDDARSGKPRARFTLAHEIGHYFLGHKGISRRNSNKALYTAASRIQEDEADIFASYFLVPTALAIVCKNAEEIAVKFQVSHQAAEIAFERIQRAQRKATGEKRPLPPGVADFMQEAKQRDYPIR